MWFLPVRLGAGNVWKDPLEDAEGGPPMVPQILLSWRQKTHLKQNAACTVDMLIKTSTSLHDALSLILMYVRPWYAISCCLKIMEASAQLTRARIDVCEFGKDIVQRRLIGIFMPMRNVVVERRHHVVLKVVKFLPSRRTINGSGSPLRLSRIISNPLLVRSYDAWSSQHSFQHKVAVMHMEKHSNIQLVLVWFILASTSVTFIVDSQLLTRTEFVRMKLQASSSPLEREPIHSFSNVLGV